MVADDYELRGKVMRKGDRVFQMLAAANRDPEIFAEPDCFDIARADSSRHVTFGFGIHFCIGAPLARLEGQVAFPILLERLEGVRSLADRAQVAGSGAPWEETGRLIARFHREGLEHADLNAHNILLDGNGRGWLIDFDRGRMRIPATGWREANLRRLLRSLLKLRGQRSVEEVEKDFSRLRRAYELSWNRGC